MKNAAHVRNNKQAAAACRQKRLQGTATPSQDSGRAGKTGHKKGILSNLPHSHARQFICCSMHLQLSRHSTTWSNRTSRRSRIWSSHMPRHRTSRRSRRKPKLRSQQRQPALGSLLVRITAAAYHCYGSHDNNKRKKIFFISVRGLIISYSVTSQRYIFVRILQIKISDIFKACVCFGKQGHRLPADRATRRKRSRESNLSVQKVCHGELLALHECLGKCRCDLTLQDDGLLGRQAVSHHDLEIGILVHRVYHDPGIGLLERASAAKAPARASCPLSKKIQTL